MSLSKDNTALYKAFETILSIKGLRDYIMDITFLIHNNELDRIGLENILEKYKIRRIEDIKEELLDLLIIYINLVLDDHIISDNEKYNVEVLKRFFKIKEGDFYNYRYQEVERILHRQFLRIYLDGQVTEEEAIHKVELQGLFDLGYDQFINFNINGMRSS